MTNLSEREPCWEHGCEVFVHPGDIHFLRPGRPADEMLHSLCDAPVGTVKLGGGLMIFAIIDDPRVQDWLPSTK